MSSTYDQGKLSTSVDGEIDNHPKKDTADSKQSQHRKRKKQYFNAIRQQMEFYFSDANLTKDRFLKKQIATDPCKAYTVFFFKILSRLSVHLISMITSFVCRCSFECIYEIQQNKGNGSIDQ